MSKSMLKDKRLKSQNDAKSKQQFLKRQRKRDAVRAKKAIYSPKRKDDKTKKSENDKTKTENDDESKTMDESTPRSIPKYKIADNIPSTMRALVKENDSTGYVLKNDYPVPTPKEDELLIRSFAVSICGSDSILYNWTKDAQTIAKLPFIPGHEAAGLIVGAGMNCRFKIGQRVAIENHFYCGECYQCSINRKDICANLQQFGHGKGTIYGGCCDYYVAKEKYCYRLKADISWRDAALLEPLGVAHNACEQADLNVLDKKDKNNQLRRETVLVVGCGTIGCMAIGVAKTMPVTGTIIACDVVDDKLKIAQKMGADHVFNVKDLKTSLKEHIMSLTDNVGVGRIIECSGHAPTIQQIFGCLRKGGCITLVGLPKEKLVINNVLQDLIFKSIQIRSIHGRRIFRTWNKTERLVSDRKINLDPLVSHVLPLEQFESGYKALQSGTALKVVFDLSKKAKDQ